MTDGNITTKDTKSTKGHKVVFKNGLCPRLYSVRIFLAVMVLATASCTPARRAPEEAAAPAQSALSLLPAVSNPTPTFTPFQPATPTTAETTLPAPSPLPSRTSAPVLPSPTAASPTTASTMEAVPLPSPQAPTPAAGTGLAVWLDPGLPDALRQSVKLPPGFVPAAQEGEAVLKVVVGDQRPVSRWVYALVAPFPSYEEGTSLERLQKAWREAGDTPLMVDESTLAVFSAWWGPPGPGVVRVPTGELVERAWNSQPAWALVPFEAVEPRWKVLAVEGQSPLWKSFDLASYPLSIPVSLLGDQALADELLSLSGPASPAPLTLASNRDPNRLTTVAMTGVTALVRATAFTMEQKGVNYPGRDVRDALREADFTHISNEVPFAKDCPSPNPNQESMRFCSDPRYIGLLEDVGTDIVELTGDHFQDWGEQAMLYTLDLYRERGWLYYGGGANLEEARGAVTVEHNGNRLAFIGCNAKGGGYAQAGPHHPGAVVCDRDWMQAEIARLRQDGYLPIVTFQHFEYYTYQAQPDQKKDFRGMADAGAVIVSGSQAHQPQAMEFENGAFIHYGLGNLFFDQYDISLACRQAFIDRHVFYNGRYLGVELLPLMFVDYARPRYAEPDERQQLLQSVFRASGW